MKTLRDGWVYKYRETPLYRFKVLRRVAKRRGVRFALGFKYYSELLGKGCSYCQGPIEERACGIDQAIPGRGYTRENSVPCCGVCNVVKNAIFTEQEMRDVIGPAVAKVRKRRPLTLVVWRNTLKRGVDHHGPQGESA